MEIIAETPWWVYVLFAVLVIVGLRATRPRTISFNKLLLLPAIFTIWNILWLAERLSGRYSLLLYWLIGIAIGAVIGWQTVRTWKTQVNHQTKSITLPGSWTTLILILLVFAVRYFFVYNYQLHPAHSNNFFLADSFISGIFTGIFTGRSFDLYQKYRKG